MRIMKFDTFEAWVKACAILTREGIAFTAIENNLTVQLEGY